MGDGSDTSATDLVTVFPRRDGRWAWHRQRHGNNEIVSGDVAQGYENKTDAIAMAVELNPGCRLEIAEKQRQWPPADMETKGDHG